MLLPDSINAAVHQRRLHLPMTLETPPGKKLRHPAERSARIFVDTANIEEIKALLAGGLIDGVTTNPSLLKKAGATSWDGAKEIMREICKLMNPHPVSLELTELEPAKMIKQAEELAALGENTVIKVPIGGYRTVCEICDPYGGLGVIRKLWERDIKVNVTLIFNSTQAYWAARAGAAYVSPFLGRLADYMYKNDDPAQPAGNSLYSIGDEPGKHESDHVFNTEYVAAHGPRKDAGVRLIHEIATIFANYDLQSLVLAASLRNPVQISECLLAGADILTVPADILKTVPDHPLTDNGMTSFYKDSQVFSDKSGGKP